MQHDHVLKKLDFYLLTPSQRVRGVWGLGRDLRAIYIYLLPTARDSHYIDMLHDHVLEKLNFDLLIPSPGWGVRGSASKIFATILLHL